MQLPIHHGDKLTTIDTPNTIFDNSNFIVIDKPSGWLSIPSRDGKKDSRPVAGIWLQENKSVRLWPVHRLDLEVSGLLMFAKNAKSHATANQWFESRKVSKLYSALTEIGAEMPDAGTELTWRCKIAKGKKRAYEATFGKDAETVVRFCGEVSLGGLRCGHWLMMPKTGRSHQLRFEMFRHQMPIIGDELYGSKLKCKDLDGIALRAIELDFSQCDQLSESGLPEKISVMDTYSSSSLSS